MLRAMREIVETFERGDRRVTIFRRPNGTFGLIWEHYSNDPYEECWIPDARVPETFCDTLQTAKREAQGRLGCDSN